MSNRYGVSYLSAFVYSYQILRVKLQKGGVACGEPFRLRRRKDYRLWPYMIELKRALCTGQSQRLKDDDPIRVNFDIGRYKYLTVGETLNITCENTLNNDPPSWAYPARLFKDPRLKVLDNGPKSRMEIKNAAADDAGKYGCGIDYEIKGKKFQTNKTIEVIEPDLDDDYWVPSETKVLIDKTVGRLILRQYNGVNNAELFITNYTKNDDGKYFCHAENIAGNAHEYFRVGHKKEYKLDIEAIATGKSVEPTNNSEPESQPSIPDARGNN
ncbi:hypothetical protein B566_EDAN017631 [Ephemera danica]|nr:hypothetical protein B566_EDAN017631 [Ephemera danica]